MAVELESLVAVQGATKDANLQETSPALTLKISQAGPKPIGGTLRRKKWVR